MNRQDKKIMRENRLVLLENLQLESVLQYLVSTNILSPQMFEDIEAVKSIRDRRVSKSWYCAENLIVVINS